MTSKGKQEAALVLPDRQILELAKRIDALRKAIDKLEREDSNSTNQAQLLSDILISLNTLQRFCA